ncbi:MAG: hypothetical protein AAF567_26275 [Actinomycetota bacterium]
MALLKLESVDAFVVRDFDEDIPAFGIVRSAPKILQGGAKELARSQTYQCAVFNMRCQGASAGINAAPEDRERAIEAFVEELLPMATSGALMLDPGKGVADNALDGLFAADPRNDAHRRAIGTTTNQHHLTGFGAVVCAENARPLDGATVAIENFDAAGATIAAQVAERGGSITAISTADGTVLNADGFDPSTLTEAHAEHGASMVSSLADETLPGWRVLGAEADVLFAGSKMGLISHTGAPNIKASLVVPTGPIPYTTKGAIMLERQGTTVLPDMVTTAGAMFAGMPPDGDAQDDIEGSVTQLLGALTSQIMEDDDMPILAACHRAESFLRSWREDLPFGRPFAA